MDDTHADQHELDKRVEIFRTGGPKDRFKALAELGEYNFEEIRDVLFDALKDNNHRIRSAAAKIIGKRGDETVITPIMHYLYDDSWIVRASAQEALSFLPKKIAFPVFRGILSSSGGDPNLRKHIAGVLGRHTDPEASELLVQMYYNSDDEELRAQIAENLGKFVQESAMKVLFEALGDDSWNVRTAAIRSLGGIEFHVIRKRALQALANPNRLVHMAMIELLIRLGNEDVIDAMAETLEGDNTLAKINALNVLSGIQSDESLTMMVSALSDPNSKVRSHAVDALANSKSIAVFELIKRCLNSSNWNLKHGAITVLGRIQNDESIDLLEKNIVGANAAQKVYILGTLAKIGSRRCIRIIANHISDPDLGEEGIRVVESLDPDLAISHLVGMLSEIDLFDASVKALTGFERGKVLRYLASKIGTGTETQKIAAILAVGRLGGREAENFLLKSKDSFTAPSILKAINQAIASIQRKIK